MKYDLIISKIDKSHKNTLAKLLCGDPTISLQKAQSMLENLPITYKKGLVKDDLKREVEKLRALGAEVMPIESKVEEDLFEEILVAEDKHISPDEVKKEASHPKKSTSVEKVRKTPTSSRMQNISRIGPPIKKKKKGSSAGVVVLVGVVILFFLLILQGLKKPEYRIKTDAPLVKKGSTSSNKERGKTSSSKTKKKNNLNIFSSMKEKKERKKAQKVSDSKNYSDSAEMFLNDPDEMIKFYKIAISINRKNFNAWSGLVNAYANMGMTKEAYKAKEEMKKIFGEEMFSVEELIRPYGTLVSFNQGKDGFCRLEYKSKAKKKVVLESESFTLLKSLNTSIGCGRYSLYASTGKGKGMLVRYDNNTFPNTFSAFLLKAQINFID